MKDDKTDCTNYGGISLLSTSYKILSSILLPSLNPYVHEIIEDNHCEFRRNRSTTDQIKIFKKIMLRVVLYRCETWFLILREEHSTLYPKKLALTLPTIDGRSVGVVRLLTKATEF
jgi:hypothetical protein